MKSIRNTWDAIDWLYAEHRDAILAGPANEWAMDPCDWTPIIQMTPIERCIWGDIREANAVFYPQWPVGGVYVDFANPAAKVAIECDGAAYHTDKAKDAARDEKLAALGWVVYRITGRDCHAECDEETGAQGYARRFVEAIASYHGLKRQAGKALGFGHGFYACLPLLDRLMGKQ